MGNRTLRLSTIMDTHKKKKKIPEEWRADFYHLDVAYILMDDLTLLPQQQQLLLLVVKVTFAIAIYQILFKRRATSQHIAVSIEVQERRAPRPK